VIRWDHGQKGTRTTWRKLGEMERDGIHHKFGEMERDGFGRMRIHQDLKSSRFS